MKKKHGEQSRRRGGRWSTDGAGEGEEGASPSGTGQLQCFCLTRQVPARGTANLNRCAETAAPQKRGRAITWRVHLREATGQNLIQMWVIWTGQNRLKIDENRQKSRPKRPKIDQHRVPGPFGHQSRQKNSSLTWTRTSKSHTPPNIQDLKNRASKL